MKSRRTFLKSSSLALTTLAGLGLSQSVLGQNTCDATAKQPKGPFYPVVNQADKDTDLTHVAGSSQKAIGTVVWVEGTVRDTSCVPIEGALVEIWQACASGRYNHPNDPNTAPLDPNFQYWGRALSDKNGFYRFKTIIPGAYPADVGWVRPPHIHFRVLKRGYHELITQMYFAGEALNQQDRILQSLTPTDQSHAIVQFVAPTTGAEPVGIFDLQLAKP